MHNRDLGYCIQQGVKLPTILQDCQSFVSVTLTRTIVLDVCNSKEKGYIGMQQSHWVFITILILIVYPGVMNSLVMTRAGRLSSRDTFWQDSMHVHKTLLSFVISGAPAPNPSFRALLIARIKTGAPGGLFTTTYITSGGYLGCCCKGAAGGGKQSSRRPSALRNCLYHVNVTGNLRPIKTIKLGVLSVNWGGEWGGGSEGFSNRKARQGGGKEGGEER